MVKRFTGGLLSPRAPGVSSSSATGFWSFVDATQNRSNVSWPTGVTEYLPIDIFMVAGGGVGGACIGSGGGAGGVLAGSLINYPLRGTYTIYIGAGGAAGVDGINGSNTAIEFLGANIYTAHGGGGGYTYTETNGVNPGKAGGSGSGGAGNRGGTSAGGNATQTSQLTLVGYGYPGGIGKATGGPIHPAGGGGAGAAGQDGQNTGTTKAGDGGDGIYNNFRTGTNIGYAGGGSGQSYDYPAYNSALPTNKRSTFGGGVSINNADTPGVPNTGGGGGGAGFSPYSGPASPGSGGSGIVIIRYHTNFITATGGNVTNYTLGGVPITAHTFTESNTFVITSAG